MRNLRTLLLCCAMWPIGALAQDIFSPWRPPYTYLGNKATAIAAPIEISFGYSHLRANEGPGQCGCFNMRGGNTEVAFHNYRWLSSVADLTGERAGNVNDGHQGLSLAIVTAGPRFTYPIHHRYAPFGQALFGVAHGFDSFFPVTSGSTGAANGLAVFTGGGLDIRLTSYLAIRAVQADYLLTHIPNGVNNSQNNLRIGAGIVLRLW